MAQDGDFLHWFGSCVVMVYGYASQLVGYECHVYCGRRLCRHRDVLREATSCFINCR